VNDTPLQTAERLAEELLFPAALTTDRAESVPAAHFQALADAGLYGVAGPRDAGGSDQSPERCAAITEVLASGCLATAFVWLQHHGSVRALTLTQNAALRREWLAPLCLGHRRGGLALGGVRSRSQPLLARPGPGGWHLSGEVPWVTGWGLVDALYTLALMQPEVPGEAPRDLLSLLVDARESDSLRVTPLQLVAANSSRTVTLRFDEHLVPLERQVSLEPYTPPAAHDGGGRTNGSLALGVTSRCCTLLGPSSLDEALRACRERLDAAKDETLAEARAAASLLALRASATVITALGSRSILLEHHAQRLLRESAFLLTFGTRPAIRAALLAGLGG
jgi:alkylation response protein AidB-like acyl-CoA dehydrogenase